MRTRPAARPLALALAAVLVSSSAFAQAAAATQAKPYEPQVGQAGKDVVWVPTPQSLVDTMLDMAKVTPEDFVIDLGSGDGRTVITAAKRGSRAMGIEYNPEMVELSKKNAVSAGVTDKVTFMKADLFETDLSKAQVITMFLLPAINMKLRPKLLDLKPGTRLVSNTFTMEDWQADDTKTVTDGCVSWCTALLWIVPAKVEGTWQTPKGELKLTQQFQVISGTLAGAALENAKLHGDDITFSAGGTAYTGKVNGSTIRAADGSWTATRK